MTAPRKFPVFANQTVEQWLSGHSERVYAVVGTFTFSIALDNGKVARIERYDKPDRIPDTTHVTELIGSTTKLAEYLIRWSSIYPNDREILWDEQTTRKTEVVA
jgi:hypothetical protein